MVSEALVASLLAWTAASSGYEIPDGQLPAVTQLPPWEITSTFYEGETPPDSPMNIVALYHWPTDTIMVPVGMEFASPYGQAALIHELTHWLQFHNGRHDDVNCLAELEPEAYNVQTQWLIEHGHASTRLEAHDLMQTNDFTIMMIGICWEGFE